MLPTIADVLALPAVAAGLPEVLTGTDALERKVRWVHVAPPSGGRRLLLGGELLLSTGVGWPSEPTALTGYVRELAAAHVAGLVLELGNRYDAPPGALVTACEASGLPLVALRREVRFVSITEAVHSRIVDAQAAALRERDRVHAVFAELNRRGCSATFLLDQAARMLDRPVVLEDLNHRALAWSAAGREPAVLLADWAAQSRRAVQQAVACAPPYERTRCWADAGWLRTPVEAQGQQWGTLVALDCAEVPEAAEVVLENAALALSLGAPVRPRRRGVVRPGATAPAGQLPHRGLRVAGGPANHLPGVRLARRRPGPGGSGPPHAPRRRTAAPAGGPRAGGRARRRRAVQPLDRRPADHRALSPVVPAGPSGPRRHGARAPG
jgi:hypothetical protein